MHPRPGVATVFVGVFRSVSRYRKLNEALGQVLEEYSLVSRQLVLRFVPGYWFLVFAEVSFVAINRDDEAWVPKSSLRRRSSRLRKATSTEGMF